MPQKLGCLFFGNFGFVAKVKDRCCGCSKPFAGVGKGYSPKTMSSNHAQYREGPHRVRFQKSWLSRAFLCSLELFAKYQAQKQTPYVKVKEGSSFEIEQLENTCLSSPPYKSIQKHGRSPPPPLPSVLFGSNNCWENHGCPWRWAGTAA